MSAYAKLFFRPGAGEQITTRITLEPESASAICGRVVGKNGASVENALVLLFKSEGNAVGGCKSIGIGGGGAIGVGATMDDRISNGGAANAPIDRFFTDADGQFFFGPLESETLYVIKIYKNDTKLRELEVITE